MLAVWISEYPLCRFILIDTASLGSCVLASAGGGGSGHS
jgi:hypothetical protein